MAVGGPITKTTVGGPAPTNQCLHVPQKGRNAVSYQVRGLHKGGLGGVHILTRDRTAGMAEQRRNRKLPVAHILGDRGKGVAQRVGRYVGQKAGGFRPRLAKRLHGPAEFRGEDIIKRDANLGTDMTFYNRIAKRDFTQTERDKAADRGAAMPGGEYPIYTPKDGSVSV